MAILLIAITWCRVGGLCCPHPGLEVVPGGWLVLPPPWLGGGAGTFNCLIINFFDNSASFFWEMFALREISCATDNGIAPKGRTRTLAISQRKTPLSQKATSMSTRNTVVGRSMLEQLHDNVLTLVTMSMDCPRTGSAFRSLIHTVQAQQKGREKEEAG
uniref:Secreted protein n=1 Tax=Globodera pallida TaxID=36090 RepID=A0A183BZP4_GLOPA